MKIKNISNLELQVYVCSLHFLCVSLRCILGGIYELFAPMEIYRYSLFLLYDTFLLMNWILFPILAILVFFTKGKSSLWRFFNALHVFITAGITYPILFYHYYKKKDYTYNIKLAKILLFSLVFLCVAYLIVIGCLIYKFVINVT